MSHGRCATRHARLHAELDPVGGATVRAMLDSLSQKTDEGDQRSFLQRRADALAHMATLAKANQGRPQGTLQSARVLPWAAAGRTGVRTRGLGRSRGPNSRDGTPRGGNCHTHVHQHGWQITRDAFGRYRAGPPPSPLDN